MTTRPSDPVPEWATDAAAEIETPATQLQNRGWLANVVRPDAILNWFWNGVGQWLGYYDDDIESGRAAGKEYKYDDPANRRFRLHVMAEDLAAYQHTAEVVAGGAPVVQYSAYDEAAAAAFVWVDAAFSGEVHLYYPLHLPDKFSLSQFGFTALRNTASALVEVDIVYAEPGATAARPLMFGGSTMQFGDTSGTVSQQPLTPIPGAPRVVTRRDRDKLYLRIRLRNDGAANSTARFYGLTLEGFVGTVAHAGWVTRI